jgi:hypothetical protein
MAGQVDEGESVSELFRFAQPPGVEAGNLLGRGWFEDLAWNPEELLQCGDRTMFLTALGQSGVDALIPDHGPKKLDNFRAHGVVLLMAR